MSDELKEQPELDGMFMSLLQNSKSGIDGFYYNLFGFLRRKSDFFKTDEAFATVQRNFDKQVALYREDKERQAALEKKRKEEKAKKEAEELAKQKEKEQKEKKGEVAGTVQEVTDEEADRIMKEEAERKAKIERGEDPDAKEDKKEDKKEEDDDKVAEGKVRPSPGNGSKNELYEWTQSLDDCLVNIYLPNGCKANQLDVKMTNTKFKVGLKGQAPIIDGEFYMKIKVDDSTWSIESDGDRRVMQLLIQKFEGQRWWGAPFKGHVEIDTQKVEPENSKLSDLDLETRAAVEKMMFDQNQKMKGMPTSDELEKKDKLKGFMAAHPEMDFSKCKFM